MKKVLVYAWFLCILGNNKASSKFLKIDLTNGTVMSSFQLTNSAAGISIKAYQFYFISNEELIISLDANLSNNNLGLSQDSKLDSVVLIVNVTSGTVLRNSIWDIQNGMEFSTTIEFQNGFLYQLGIKDDIYLFIKKLNLTSLSLEDQKVFLPSSQYMVRGHKSFHSYGIAGDNIVSIYDSYSDKLWIILIDKNTLSIIKFWNIEFPNDSILTYKGWMLPYTKS